MINSSKHKEEQIFKVLTLCLFLLISVASVTIEFTENDSGFSHFVSYSEQIDNGNAFVISDIHIPNFNSLIFSKSEIDRFNKSYNKYLVYDTNAKTFAEYKLSQRKYLNYKPITLSLSNPIWRTVISYEDYPSVS